MLTGGYTTDNPGDISGYTRVDAVKAPQGRSWELLPGAGIGTTIECASRCNTNSECMGFNYSFDPPQNTCVLVRTVTPETPYTGSKKVSLFKKNV
jgi:hypothetical protein